MTPQQQARLDFEQTRHAQGITLSLPKEELFNVDAFFKLYEDPIIDRERERELYMLKRDGKRIVKHRPKRAL